MLLARRRHRLPIVLTFLALIAAGCGSGTPEPPVPSGTIPGAGPVATTDRVERPRASESATEATQTLPPLPPTAMRRTVAGAEAFVRYYMELTNEVGIRPRLGLLAPLSSATCKSCDGLERDTAALMKARRSYNAKPLKIDEVFGLDGRPEKDSTYEVAAAVVQGGHSIVDKDGNAVQQVPVTRHTFIVELAWDSGWKVDEIRLLAPPAKPE